MAENLCGVDSDLNDYFVDKIDELAGLLRQAWCAESAEDPLTWQSGCGSRGQSAVTALLVEDRFAGEILRVRVGGGWHYYNRLDGVEIDLSRNQFSVFAPRGKALVVGRDSLEADGEVARRYAVLACRFNEIIWGECSRGWSGMMPYYAAGMSGNAR
jgi:hypothetical protein